MKKRIVRNGVTAYYDTQRKKENKAETASLCPQCDYYTGKKIDVTQKISGVDAVYTYECDKCYCVYNLGNIK